MSLGSTFLGAVVEADRGSLPYALIHGESLVACAAWALGESGARVVDVGPEWADIVDTGAALVLHDALCPMTSPGFLAECAERAVALDRVVVGVRPVTDTVKVVERGPLEGYVGGTVDREQLRQVASPVVLPASVVAALDRPLDLDFVRLVTALAEQFDVDEVTAPPDARRVATVEDIRVLEALTLNQR